MLDMAVDKGSSENVLHIQNVIENLVDDIEEFENEERNHDEVYLITPYYTTM